MMIGLGDVSFVIAYIFFFCAKLVVHILTRGRQSIFLLSHVLTVIDDSIVCQ